MRNLSQEKRQVILKTSTIFKIIYLIIDEIRKIESSFLSKIYMNTFNNDKNNNNNDNNDKNKGLKTVAILRTEAALQRCS